MQTAAAVRATISNAQKGLTLGDFVADFPMAILAEEFLPSLEEEKNKNLTAHQLRQLSLLSLAFSDLEASISDSLDLNGIPLILNLSDRAGVSESDDVEAKNIHGMLFDACVAQMGLAIDENHSGYLCAGRAGCGFALDAALEVFANSDHDYLLLAAVDSCYDASSIQTMKDADRFLVGDNSDAHIPSEGAAFVLLSRNKKVFRYQDLELPEIKLLTPGLAEESSHRLNDQPVTADGLSLAMESALNELTSDKIRTVLSTANGEQYYHKELAIAKMRHYDELMHCEQEEFPAISLGDSGAASGFLLIALACIGMSKKYLPTPIMVACASEYAARSVVCVQ